jgi:hypothetical protein
VEIKSVEPFEDDWTKEYDKNFLKIVVITDCYGCIEERNTIESEEDWEKIKERGYFMW